jgi:hypothetical protein
LITRLSPEIDLEEENLYLKSALLQANATIQALEESINGAGASWLQYKNSVQRKTLRILSNRIRCQRLVLGLINGLGRLPSEQELREVYDRMKAEGLDPIEAARAVNIVL